MRNSTSLFYHINEEFHFTVFISYNEEFHFTVLSYEELHFTVFIIQMRNSTSLFHTEVLVFLCQLCEHGTHVVDDHVVHVQHRVTPRRLRVGPVAQHGGTVHTTVSTARQVLRRYRPDVVHQVLGRYGGQVVHEVLDGRPLRLLVNAVRRTGHLITARRHLQGVELTVLADQPTVGSNLPIGWYACLVASYTVLIDRYGWWVGHQGRVGKQSGLVYVHTILVSSHIGLVPHHAIQVCLHVARVHLLLCQLWRERHGHLGRGHWVCISSNMHAWKQLLLLKCLWHLGEVTSSIGHVLLLLLLLLLLHKHLLSHKPMCCLGIGWNLGLTDMWDLDLGTSTLTLLSL